MQGDYWHGNPLYYGENKKPLNDTQKFKIGLDEKKFKYAIEYGYKIYYIWETEIKSQDFTIIDIVCNEFKNEKI